MNYNKNILVTLALYAAILLTSGAMVEAKENVRRANAKNGRGRNLNTKNQKSKKSKKSKSKSPICFSSESSVVDPNSEKAGLQFSVDRTAYYLENGTQATPMDGAAIYLAAVLEYLSATILELAQNVTRGDIGENESVIVPDHINTTVTNDDELNKLFGDDITGGVLPNIHATLLPNNDADNSPGGLAPAETSFANDIVKVLNQMIIDEYISDDTCISVEGLTLIDSLIVDTFERITVEADKLATYKKATLSSREIQTAVRLMLPGELPKYAVSAGTEAVTLYSSSTDQKYSSSISVRRS